MRSDWQDLLCGGQHQLQEEVRHDQPVADIGEAVLLFVFGKSPYGIVALAFNPAVAVVVDELRYRAGSERGAIEVEEIPECVSQLDAVQSADDGLRPGAAQPGVGAIEAAGKSLNEFLSFLQARLGLLFRRHLSEVDLVEHFLPGLEYLAVCEVGSNRVEAPVVLLFFRSVAGDAILLQEGLQSLQGIVGLCRGQRKRNDDGDPQGDATHRNHAFVSSPVRVPVLVPKRSISRPKFCSIDKSRLAAGTRLPFSSG